MGSFTYRCLSGNELADNLAKKGAKIVNKNNKIPLTSVKTLIRTKSDHKTKKIQTKIAQTKIWKNIRTLWDGNKTKPKTKANNLHKHNTFNTSLCQSGLGTHHQRSNKETAGHPK